MRNVFVEKSIYFFGILIAFVGMVGVPRVTLADENCWTLTDTSPPDIIKVCKGTFQSMYDSVTDPDLAEAAKSCNVGMRGSPLRAAMAANPLKDQIDVILNHCDSILAGETSKEGCGSGVSPERALLFLVSAGTSEIYNAAVNTEVGTGHAGCCLKKKTDKKITIGGGEKDCSDFQETCKDGKIVNYSCCVCEQPDKSTKYADRPFSTYESCAETCKGLYGSDSKPSDGLGAGSLGKQSGAPPPSVMAQRMMYCWSKPDCATAEGTFNPGGCPDSSEGKCIAPEPVIQLSSPFGSVTTVKGYRGFVAALFSYLLIISGIAAGIMFVWAGFRYIFGSAFTSIQKAKDIMIDASVGLVLVIAAVAILRTINPATLNLNKLDVFMINKKKLMLGQSNLCTDIQAAKGKELTFADAKKNDKWIAITEVKDAEYTVKQKETKCNSYYYAKAYGDYRCMGQACPGEGMACLSCEGGGNCPEGASSDSFGCVKARLAGTIAYSDEKAPAKIRLLVICNAAYNMSGGNNKYDDVEKYMAVVTKETEFRYPENYSQDHGKVTYSVDVTDAVISNAKSACGGADATLGFMLGIHYLDAGHCVKGALSTGGNALNRGQGWAGAASGGLLGCLAGWGGLSNNDVIVVSKKWCVTGGKFPGLQNGDMFTNDDAIKRAAWCGLTELQFGKTIPSRINKDTIWSLKELEESDEKPIVCNFGLSNENAPNDPTFMLSDTGLGTERTTGIECSKYQDGI